MIVLDYGGASAFNTLVGVAMVIAIVVAVINGTAEYPRRLNKIFVALGTSLFLLFFIFLFVQAGAAALGVVTYSNIPF